MCYVDFNFWLIDLNIHSAATALFSLDYYLIYAMLTPAIVHYRFMFSNKMLELTIYNQKQQKNVVLLPIDLTLSHLQSNSDDKIEAHNYDHTVRCGQQCES